MEFDNDNMEKSRLQRMYCDYLQDEGFKIEIEKNGDIAFLYKNFWVEIEIYDEELNYNRLCLMAEYKFDETNIFQAYLAASEISGGFKLTKAYIRDGNVKSDKQFVVFAIPFFLENFDDFKKNFKRMLDEILNACHEFNEILNTLNNLKNSKN